MTRTWRAGRAADERGATLALVAITTVVMLSFTSFAVDLSRVYNERRQDQSAADSAAIGGGMEASYGPQAITDKARSLVRVNLDSSYTDSAWNSAWTACQDAKKFALLGSVGGAPTQCVSLDPRGRVRVKVPDQVVQMAFAKVMGVHTLKSTAASVVTIAPPQGGVLPFAAISGDPDYPEVCLKSSSGGHAVPPCDGPHSGNFGTLDSPRYEASGTSCAAGNNDDRLVANIALGIDHLLLAYNASVGEVRDQCSVWGANTINTLTGNRKLFEGMIAGGSSGGVSFTGRLLGGPNTKRTLIDADDSYALDNLPLWQYIPYGKGISVPATCTREGFDGLSGTAATTRLEQCLIAYADGTGYARLFDLKDANGEYMITRSPRFGFVPMFDDLGNGNSWLRILDFVPVFIQTMWFNCNAHSCELVFKPGEGTTDLCVSGCGGIHELRQLSALSLPVGSLPAELTDNGPSGSLGPYRVRLSA